MPHDPRRVDYDALAPTYNHRYVASDRPALAAALQALVATTPTRQVLEVGCGTGRWLEAFSAVTPAVFGLDPSKGMLIQARQRPLPLHLVQGLGEVLPFADRSFGALACINAIHHMVDPLAFIREARRVLVPGGKLAIIGTDPHDARNAWYIYNFFEGVRANDLSRFPAHETVLCWLSDAGLVGVKRRAVETIEKVLIGAQVLTDPFLQKNAVSQLALLDEAAYAAGVHRIGVAVSQNPALRFETLLHMEMLVGSVAE